MCECRKISHDYRCPSAPEEDYKCPVCDEELDGSDYIYKNNDGEIVGCVSCIRELTAAYNL